MRVRAGSLRYYPEIPLIAPLLNPNESQMHPCRLGVGDKAQAQIRLKHEDAGPGDGQGGKASTVVECAMCYSAITVQKSQSLKPLAEHAQSMTHAAACQVLFLLLLVATLATLNPQHPKFHCLLALASSACLASTASSALSSLQ